MYLKNSPFLLFFYFFMQLPFKSNAQVNADNFYALAREKKLIADSLWKQQKYATAKLHLKAVFNAYQQMTMPDQEYRSGTYSFCCYDLACAYALTGKKDSALYYLEKSVNAGYHDYYNTKRDRDLAALHNEPGYQALLDKLRLRGDYNYILKQYPDYRTDENTPETIPAFTYQDAASPELVQFRRKYNLDAIAGNEGEVSQIIRLMQWVHDTLYYVGNAPHIKNMNGELILEACIKEGQKANCGTMAILLKDIYLAMGWPARMVMCMPKPQVFDESHVITMVYSSKLQKWLWMDPTFETYMTDEKGGLLGIGEVRERMIHDRPLKVAGNLNVNQHPYKGGEAAYINYMNKNIFRLMTPVESRYGYEGQNKWTLVELIPDGYLPGNEKMPSDKTLEGNKIISQRGDVDYLIRNPEKFWTVPVI